MSDEIICALCGVALQRPEWVERIEGKAFHPICADHIRREVANIFGKAWKASPPEKRKDEGK